MARVDHRRPSIISPPSRTAGLAGNGSNGRAPAAAKGIVRPFAGLGAPKRSRNLAAGRFRWAVGATNCMLAIDPHASAPDLMAPGGHALMDGAEALTWR
jgi:hypothetical protein